jgi:hypothetical protein
VRFYQVEFYCGEQGHLGYAFRASKRDAQRTLRELSRSEIATEPALSIHAIDIEPTKAGILSALNDLASHPDNG